MIPFPSIQQHLFRFMSKNVIYQKIKICFKRHIHVSNNTAVNFKKEISVSKDTLIKSQKFYLEVFLNTQVSRH